MVVLWGELLVRRLLGTMLLVIRDFIVYIFYRIGNNIEGKVIFVDIYGVIFKFTKISYILYDFFYLIFG